MSETQKNHHAETENGSETLIKDLFETSQSSPQEFVRQWEDRASDAGLDMFALEDSFRDLLEQVGGGDPSAEVMPEQVMRTLYSLRAQGNELGMVFTHLASEMSTSPKMREDLWNFIKAQDEQAAKDRGGRSHEEVGYIEGTLKSFVDSGDRQGRPEVEPSESHGDDEEQYLKEERAELVGKLSPSQRKQFHEAQRDGLDFLDALDRARMDDHAVGELLGSLPPEKRKEFFTAPLEGKGRDEAIDRARQAAMEQAVGGGLSEPVVNSDKGVQRIDNNEPRVQTPETPAGSDGRSEASLDANALRTMYEKAHSDDPNLREDFATVSRNWSPAERDQYARYSASLQAELATQERQRALQPEQSSQQPQPKQGGLKRLWGKVRSWGRKKS